MIAYSEDVLHKANALLAQGHKISEDQSSPGIFWVNSSNGEHVYRVQTDYRAELGSLTWITCTCPHGLFTGAGSSHCYHAAAALLILRERGVKEP